jgi:DNA-binding transcriptional LysR family regulator
LVVGSNPTRPTIFSKYLRLSSIFHCAALEEVFASYSHRIMSDVREAEQSVLPLQSEPQGRLRILANESLAISLLPEALLSFQQKFPRIELDIHVSGRLVNLVEEGIDVALRVGKLEDSSLITRLLMPCGLHACASPEYLKKHGRPEHPSELETHNCLIYSQLPHPDNWQFRDELTLGEHPIFGRLLL